MRRITTTVAGLASLTVLVILGCKAFPPKPDAPVAAAAETRAAQNVGIDSAVLHGAVNPKGSPTLYRFVYGPTTSYGSMTPLLQAGTDSDMMPVNQVIKGLVGGTLYHYRIVAINAADTSVGADMTFTTRPAAPQIDIDSASLYFTAVRNGPLPAAKPINISNSGVGVLNWSITDDVNWIGYLPTSGSGNTSVQVRPTTTSLQPGVYSATLTVASAAADNSPQTVAVTYTINEPPPLIDTDSSSISFAAVQSGPLPGNKSFKITNAGGGTLNWRVSDDADWLELNPTSGSSNSATVVVSVNTTDLALGQHTATISISDPAAANTPQTIDVTYTIREPAPLLEVDSASLHFEWTQGDPNLPTPSSFRITNTGGGQLNWNVSTNRSWLSVQPASGSSNNQVINVSITDTPFFIGFTQGTVTVTSDNATNVPPDLAVACTVFVSGGAPSIQVDVDSLFFSALANGQFAPAKTFTITNAGLGVLNWTATTGTGWLFVNPQSGNTTPAVITVQPQTTSLFAPDTLEVLVTVADADADNSPVDVTIYYELLPQAPQIGLDKTELHFEAYENEDFDGAQTFTISNTGSGTLNWTATTGTAWMFVDPQSGSGPATITVQPQTTALTPDTYEVPITVADAGASNSPREVTVFYDVLEAIPEISLSADTLFFSAVQNSSFPDAQSFEITNAGAGTLNWTATTGAGWLFVDPQAGNATPTTITVQPQTTSEPAPDTLEAIITVADANATNSPQEVIIRYALEADTTDQPSTVQGTLSLFPGDGDSISLTNVRVALYPNNQNAWDLDSVLYSVVANDGDSTVEYQLTSVAPGNYFMDAWMDRNNNSLIDPGDRWGFVGHVESGMGILETLPVASGETVTVDLNMYVIVSNTPQSVVLRDSQNENRLLVLPKTRHVRSHPALIFR